MHAGRPKYKVWAFPIEYQSQQPKFIIKEERNFVAAADDDEAVQLMANNSHEIRQSNWERAVDQQEQQLIRECDRTAITKTHAHTQAQQQREKDDAN